MTESTASTDSNTLPIVGSPVTYGGSVAECRGESFLLFPHGCYVDSDDDCDCEFDPQGRHTLINFTTDRVLHHVRTKSFSAIAEPWWPKDAVDIERGGYLYKAAHTTPGGSPTTRILAYYAADGQILRTYIVFREITDQVRSLDSRGTDPARAAQTRFTDPALPTV